MTIRCESYYIWYLVDISYFCLEKRQKLPNVLLALGMSIRDNEIRDNQKKSRVTFHIQNFREYCNIFVCVFAYIKLEIELHSIHSKHLPENHLSLIYRRK